MIPTFSDSCNLDTQINIIDWGRTQYDEAFEQQKDLVKQRLAGAIADTLVFTEHDPVFTIGRRKNATQNLLWNEPHLKAKGIDLVHTNRGGDITYHGPGQVVGYAIVSLSKQRDLHRYLRNLEEVVIRTLDAFRLKASRCPGKTGIWLGTRKICAIGIAVRMWVAYHGFALNVSTDMKHFSGIIPCGINDGTVTSMNDELKISIDIDQVKKRLAVEFREVFQNSD